MKPVNMGEATDEKEGQNSPIVNNIGVVLEAVEAAKDAASGGDYKTAREKLAAVNNRIEPLLIQVNIAERGGEEVEA